jgi:hypothetical protein
MATRRRLGGIASSRLLAGAVLAIALTSCGSAESPRGANEDRAAGEVTSDVPPWRAQVKAAWTSEDMSRALPFERIELERSPCFGTCPAYTLTLWTNGEARYIGGSHAPRAGHFTGKVDLYKLGKLCELLEEAGFFSFDRKYASSWTCLPTTWLRVWRSIDEDPVVVEDYGGAGPVELWGLHTVIDEIASDMQWEDVK